MLAPGRTHTRRTAFRSSGSGGKLRVDRGHGFGVQVRRDAIGPDSAGDGTLPCDLWPQLPKPNAEPTEPHVTGLG